LLNPQKVGFIYRKHDASGADSALGPAPLALLVQFIKKNSFILDLYDDVADC
jgi:hypothetical protein